MSEHYSADLVALVAAAIPTTGPGLRAGAIFNAHGVGSPVTTRHILRDLVQAGAVARVPDPTDRTGHRQLYRRTD